MPPRLWHTTAGMTPPPSELVTRWRLSLCFCGVGVRNVTALGNLISWQKVNYDFNYHQMEFPCNINVLIASEGRSLLPVRTKVKTVHC